MEMDFMGLSSDNSSTQMEKQRNIEHPADESNKNLSLSLFQESHKTNYGSGLQLPHCRSGNVEEGDQVALYLGNSSSLEGTVVKVGNVSGSAGSPCFSAYNSEKQRSLLRFHNVAKEEIQYGTANPHIYDKAKSLTLDGHAELDIQQQNPYFKDKVPMSNMSMQRMHWTKVAALQQLMSLKGVQEERPVKRKFDWLVTSGGQGVPTADAFKSNKTTLASQKSFNFNPKSIGTPESRNIYSVANGNSNQHFGVSPATFSTRPFDDQSSLDYSLVKAQGFLREQSSSLPSNFKECLVSPSYKEQQATANSYGTCLSSVSSTNQASPSLVGTTQIRASSNSPDKLGNAQLTIFYGGTVNVYDDIPPEKAHKIMLLAGSVSSMSAKVTDSSPQRFRMSTPMVTDYHSRPATPTIGSNPQNALTSLNPQGAMQMGNACVPQVHTQKSKISSQRGQSTGSSSGDGEFQSNHSSGAANGQQDPAKQPVSGLAPSVIRRALPQARKASITRFLERRKERVVPNVPHTTKESPEYLSSETEKSFSSMSIPCFDGCPSPQHDLTSNALDVKILSNSQGKRYADQLWVQRVETKVESRGC